MKLSFISLVSSLTAVLAVKDYTTNFDYLDLGPLKQNPLRDLEYGDEFQVGAYSVQASNAKTNGKRLLFSGPTPVYKPFGSMKVAVDDVFTVKTIKLGCSGPKQNGKKETIPCDVEVTGMRPSLNEVYKKVSYTKTGELTEVDLEDDFWDLRSLSFRVIAAGQNGDVKDDVTLLLDNFNYFVGKEE
ncbi:hypothetical protein P170DRAFT_493056 [Aspergillus steynii IBT 23096]|uniref:Uncharacterized protein n=1 Tax=Aspergillus steynii IBT 23096 TaxID=1392250 RepID=A0A2I2GDD6_9EURO|nr:uncharacterized protein P170DRAFT_493056 [Aspergillus steynii IBT 23096]PLB50899.1 hypothetical protein P170DRAFT_493056 [Aspergillus steynii IBT 23096]